MSNINEANSQKYGSSPLPSTHTVVSGGVGMVIKNKHPKYETDKARAEKIREMAQLCKQRLTDVRQARKAG